jgi:hypothetical protein
LIDLVPLYLDDCLIQTALVRQLRAAGHLIYVTNELGVTGQSDELHLRDATNLSAVFATQNERDFVRAHRQWRADGRNHAGILLTRQLPDVGTRVERLERAARILTPAMAANQLMRLDLFATEEMGRNYAASLTP